MQDNLDVNINKINKIEKAKQVLKVLINNGFEGYFFGETVRNELMGLNSENIQIMTSASIEDLFKLFNNEFKRIDDQYCSFVFDDINFIAKTFINEDNNSNNKLVTNLLTDNLSLAHYTIDSLAMSVSGKIIDPFNGKKDIEKHLIRVVGQAKQRFLADPLMMLEALSLVSEFDYSLTKQTASSIKKRINALRNVNANEVSIQIKRILGGPFAKKALNLFFVLGLADYLDVFRNACKVVLKHYNSLSYDDIMVCCFMMNECIDEEYILTCENPAYVNAVYTLAQTNPQGKYDALTLFSYGLEIAIKAYRINKVLGRTKFSFINAEKRIAKEYDNLPIKKKCDLKFKGEDIMRISDLRDANTIGDIFEEIAFKVINGELKNEKEEIQEYVCGVLTQMGIPFDTTRTKIREIEPVIIRDDEV